MTQAKFVLYFIITCTLALQINGQTTSFQVLHNSLYSADNQSVIKEIYYPRKVRSSNQWVYSIGSSIGQESFIGLPKMGVYREFSLSQSNRAQRFGFSRYSAYIGAETSLFILFAGVLSASVNGGFSIGPATIDHSLTYTMVSGPSDEKPGNYATYNPKIGINIGPIWLKGGPSFIVNGNPDWGKWFKVNDTSYNIELYFVGRF